MQLIRKKADLETAMERLRRSEFVGFDTETTGLDPLTTRLRLAQLAVADEVCVIDLFCFEPDQLQPLRDLLSAEHPVKIAHNAKFDAEFLMRHLGTRLGAVFDTYLASMLISAGNENHRHGLGAVANRYLDITVDKELQLSDWSGALSESQLAYAAADATVLLPLRAAQQRKLEELHLTRTAKLEFECINAIAALELSGIYLDADCWRAQVSATRASYDEVSRSLRRALSTGLPQMSLFDDAVSEINLDSPAQVRTALARLGINLETTREGELHQYAGTHPVIAQLIEYRGLSKSLSAYGLGLLEYISPVTNRIHSHFRQIASPSGRMASSSPGLHQIPHERRYRECFKAPEGRKMIVADFSQIEMRVLAEFSRDEALITAFRSGADLHRTTASSLLGVPLEQVTASQRSQAKGLNFGLVYGMGAEGLASRINCSVPEAEDLIRKYFGAFPGVARWLDDAAAAAVRDGAARTLSGRLWKFQLDPTDRIQLGALRRVGKNAPIQGTASDLFKRAVTLVDDAMPEGEARIVHCIHDEIVVECRDSLAGEISEVVRRKMVEAGEEFLPHVPVEVDVKVTNAWLK